MWIKKQLGEVIGSRHEERINKQVGENKITEDIIGSLGCGALL